MDKNSILIELSESTRTSFGKVDFHEQTIPQKVFSALWALEGEVNNGGFSQYFFNDSCETACFVVEALETIGAPQTADLCRQAIAVAFPGGLPSDAEEIRAAVESFSDDQVQKLDDLDRKFYLYPHDLTTLLYAFVEQHPNDFGTLPATE